MKKIIETIVGIVVIIGAVFSAFFYIDATYAKKIHVHTDPGEVPISITPPQRIESGQCQYNQANDKSTLLKRDDFFNLKAYTVVIKFEKAFKQKPNVIVGLTRIDAPTKNNIRVGVEAKAVSPTGFTLEIHCWGNSTIDYVKAHWIAYGL